PEWWEKQKGSRGIRRGQWYRLVFQFPIRERYHLHKSPQQSLRQAQAKTSFLDNLIQMLTFDIGLSILH
ncbi:hypothetical protein, partial [Escherichia coli]|uniref:hypothetical protein n=1 Tax=Escherichia coli TaxID=562 RepID=UPI001AD8DD76